ncbi:MAG TPA: hypothetical protein VKY26_05755, partial [Actinomycetota bacterium]|nr:hypothetical protein [Actinomycetota bacterium]
MEVRLKIGLAAVLAVVLGAVAVLFTLTTARAAIPPWEPDHSLTDEGNLTFYDASGNVITGGN